MKFKARARVKEYVKGYRGRNWGRAARFLISLLLIIALLYWFDPCAILSTIRSAKPQFLILAALVYSFTFLLLSARWRMILRSMGQDLPLVLAYQAFAGGMILSDLTPGRIGELSRPFLVRDRIVLSKGIASVAIDRYTDILTTFILGLSGMLLLIQHRPYLLLAFLTILLILFISSAFWYKRFFIMKHLDRLGNPFLTEIVSSFAEVTDIKGILLRSVPITIIAWITHALRVVLIAKSVGYDVPMQILFLIQPLISALALVPISASGLGLVESGLAVLLAWLGVPMTVGISIALMDRAITVAFHILVGARCAVNIGFSLKPIQK